MTHPTDDEIIKRCKAAGIRWLPPAPDAGEGDFPGAFDLVTMVEMRALLATQGEPVAWAKYFPDHPISIKGIEPAYTTGHCTEHAKPGGCQLHNLHCGWPDCDRRSIEPSASQPLKAEQAKDAAEDAELLEWLEEKHYALHPIKEDQGDDTYTLWWQVTDKDKSISGHPLGNIRAAIRAARAAERKA